MRKNLLKRGVAIGLSITMISSSMGTWAETLEGASTVQEDSTEELNFQSEEASQTETQPAEISVQPETMAEIPEATEHSEETTAYVGEILTTVAEEILPEETNYTESLEETTEVPTSIEMSELETEYESEFVSEHESESNVEAETQTEESQIEESQTEEFESFEELETEGYLEGELTEGLQYEIADDQVKITGYSGSDSAVTIPNTIDGYPVKTIGRSAFAYAQNLQEITLPEGLTTIENEAFLESGLIHVVIPGSITRIDESAFKRSQLVSVEFKDGDTNTEAILGDSIFAGCQNLETIRLSENITEIGGFFISETKVESIIVPKSVKKSHNAWNSEYWSSGGAFCNTSNLKEIIFEEGIETIPEHIAEGAQSIERIVIPQGVKAIGDSAFSCATGLKNIVLPEGITTIESCAFDGATSLQQITLPESLVTIGDCAFRNTTSLQQITLPGNLITIGSSAFSESGLTSILIPESVTSVKYEAFSYSGLVSVKFANEKQNGETVLASRAFVGCTNLESIELSENIVEMGGGLIAETKVESVTVPKSVKKFDRQASWSGSQYEDGNWIDYYSGVFSGASYLKEIIFEEGTETILASIAEGAQSVERVVIPEGVKVIEDAAFRNAASLTQITFPKSLTTIGEYAFRNAASLTQVILPEGLTTIGNAAFMGATSLAQVTLPESLTVIESNVFRGDTSLTQITLPETVTTIGGSAFSDSGLTTIVIPKSVTRIEGGAFSGSQLTKAEFCEGEEDTEVVLENSVFANCENLESVKLSENIVEIGGGLISGTKVERIVIPKSVKTCGYINAGNCEEDGVWVQGYDIGALGEAPNLKEIIFEEGIEEIPGYIAERAKNIEEISIPETVKVIGDAAFKDTFNLKQITLPEGLTTIENSAFKGTGLTQVTLPEGLTTIEYDAFMESGLTSIVIPKNVTKIGTSAFKKSQLMSVKFCEGAEDTWVTMGATVFANCESLETVELSDNIVSIGGGLIAGTKVESIRVPKNLRGIGDDRGTIDGYYDEQAGCYVDSHQAGIFCDDIYLKELILPEGKSDFGDDLIKCSTWDAKCVSRLEKLAIPSSVTYISDYAFREDSKPAIYGVLGSYAETYAKEHDFTFVDGSETYWPLKLTSLELPEKLQMSLGVQETLIYTCVPSVTESQAKRAKWESSNKKVVTVENGVVTAVGEGNAEITVTLGGLTASCQIEVKFAMPEVTLIAHNKLRISWTKCDLADGYAIYRMNDDGTYSILKYITDNTILSYVNTVTSGVTYTYKVSPYRMEGNKKVFLARSAPSAPMSAKALPAAPKLQSTNMAAYNKIRIMWSKVNGCEGYVIYRSEAEDGKYIVLKTVTQASATNYVNVVKTSTTYYYKIRAFVTVNGKKIYGDYSNILSGNVISGAPQNFAMRQASSGKIVFTWDKVEDADGYVIYLYDPDTNKYKAIKNITDINVLTYGKTMAKGATYHFAMRAYRLVNGVKVYSDYGEIISTK